jgi:hypothetical protein
LTILLIAGICALVASDLVDGHLFTQARKSIIRKGTGIANGAVAQ